MSNLYAVTNAPEGDDRTDGLRTMPLADAQAVAAQGQRAGYASRVVPVADADRGADLAPGAQGPLSPRETVAAWVAAIREREQAPDGLTAEQRAYLAARTAAADPTAGAQR